MFKSVRVRIGAIYLGFLLLVAGSVVATLLAIRAQRADALVINLAGRQRMLSQRIAKAAMSLGRDPDGASRKELEQSAAQFDEALRALVFGGPVLSDEATVTLPAATDPMARGHLQVVARHWDQLSPIVALALEADASASAREGAVVEIAALTSLVLEEMEQAVRAFESAAQTKLGLLRAIQILFLGSALILLVGGFVAARLTIIEPLSVLQQAAQRMSGSDLSTPIRAKPLSAMEVEVLSQSLDSMRRQLSASRGDLERSAAVLDRRVRERTQQLTALFDLSTEIFTKREMDEVLESLVRRTRDLAGGEVAVLCLLDPSKETLRVAAVSGPPAALSSRRELLVSELVPDAGSHSADGAALHSGASCALLKPRYRQSHLGVPIRVGNRDLGMLCVGSSEPDRFQEEQARVLTLLAQAGAVALENARWHEQAGREAVLAERERLLGEIHDGLAQTLSYIDLRLGIVQSLVQGHDLPEVPEHLTLMRQTVEQASREVRRLLAGLESEGGPTRPLEELLEQEAAHFTSEQLVDTEFESWIRAPVQEPPAVTEQVVRIVGEALNNVRKHAPGSRAWLSLSEANNLIRVTVRDEGAGFEPEGPLPTGRHFGLKIMRARATRIGAELSVESAPGEGTSVTLSWPRSANGS